MKGAHLRHSCSHCVPVSRRRLSFVGIALGVFVVAGLSGTVWLRARGDALPPATGAGNELRRRAEELIGYSKTVPLTAEQERVKAEALSGIKAPCGAGESLAVRCCSCNLGKSINGLANHLIAREGADAGRVRQAVLEWLRETNPSGYSGTACSRKRCAHPFREDACGGMGERLIF